VTRAASVAGGLTHGSALIERCPRCCSVFVAPLRSWRRPSKTVAVYECTGCCHAWFTSYSTAALGTEWGAEPVRIGDAL
jgi:hypothetical protein